MLENEFTKIAEKTLDDLADSLDELDASGELEVEYQNYILTITLDSGKQFIVNKHAPSQQIWLSSPVSGGLHFPYEEAAKQWKLADGRVLQEVLMAEISELSE